MGSNWEQLKPPILWLQNGHDGIPTLLSHRLLLGAINEIINVRIFFFFQYRNVKEISALIIKETVGWGRGTAGLRGH